VHAPRTAAQLGEVLPSAGSAAASAAGSPSQRALTAIMAAGLPVQRALNATPASSTQRPQNAVGEPVAVAGAGAAGAAGTPTGPPGAGATSTVLEILAS